jgi:hypothetical protein
MNNLAIKLLGQKYLINRIINELSLYILCNCAFLLLTILFSGCQSCSTISSQAADGYYLNPDKNLYNVGRVALVELSNDSSYPQVSNDVTKALYIALQKKQLFGLTIINQENPTWRSLQLEMKSPSQKQNSAFGGPSTYSLEQLMTLRDTLKSDAVLTGTITEYKPYPHMAIGMRLKLLDINDGQLLWAFEQVWDCADKKTEAQIKKYFKSQMRSGFEPLREQLVVISPLKFINFVAYETAETLQPTKRYCAQKGGSLWKK